jgi:pyruvate/2-oxoglutarate dehydrogenase complex dihydrolipoamide acyltransferase (E2) component
MNEGSRSLPEQESTPSLSLRRSSRKAFSIAIALAILAVGIYVFWPRASAARVSPPGGNSGKSGRGGGSGGGIPVVAARAYRGNIGVYFTGLGAVTPIYTVTVKSRVDGQLFNVYYKEGDLVHQGDLLVEIDPRPYEAALTQAQGQLLRDKATLENARIDLARYQALVPQRAAPEQQGRLYRVSERAFNRIIGTYGRTLQIVLRYRNVTLLVALGTLALTIFLYIVIPKGFFPIQDTGVIQGVSEAPQTVSFGEMSSRQQALALVILKDPAVASLSSFIGIDGTNLTLNSGRIQINLKPLDERKISALDVIRRLQPKLANIAGITLYMQPVQDLTVEDRVSRTEFQYTLEDPKTDELSVYAPRSIVAEQRAAYDASADAYRQTVLTAFQQVEDNLAALRVLENEWAKVQETMESAKEALNISDAQYRAGTVDYLNVITAQATLLDAQRTSVQLVARRLVASVALIQALGGGWNASELPSREQVQAKR